MLTVSILIGNTDNKLTQLEWANFVMQTKGHIVEMAERVHFCGAPPTWETWQNVCWVIELEDRQLPDLKSSLSKLKRRFKQESIALLVGQTEFV